VASSAATWSTVCGGCSTVDRRGRSTRSATFRDRPAADDRRAPTGGGPGRVKKSQLDRRSGIAGGSSSRFSGAGAPRVAPKGGLRWGSFGSPCSLGHWHSPRSGSGLAASRPTARPTNRSPSSRSRATAITRASRCVPRLLLASASAGSGSGSRSTRAEPAMLPAPDAVTTWAGRAVVPARFAATWRGGGRRPRRASRPRSVPPTRRATTTSPCPAGRTSCRSRSRQATTRRIRRRGSRSRRPSPRKTQRRARGRLRVRGRPPAYDPDDSRPSRRGSQQRRPQRPRAPHSSSGSTDEPATGPLLVRLMPHEALRNDPAMPVSVPATLRSWAGRP